MRCSFQVKLCQKESRQTQLKKLLMSQHLPVKKITNKMPVVASRSGKSKRHKKGHK